MKKLIILLISIFFAAGIYAQTPDKMSYQAVIRNSNNELVPNQQVGMQSTILKGSADGAVVYIETQIPTTNTNGLINVEIGAGTIVTGDFSEIYWGEGPYYLKTEIDPAGGSNYSITATNQLLSVPYAMYAKNAGDAYWEKTEDEVLSFDGYINLKKDILLGWEEKQLRLYLMRTGIGEDNFGYKFSWRDYSNPFKENFNALEFDQNGNVYLRDGKVGIGTINPKRKLHITEDIALGNDEAGQMFVLHSRSNGDPNSSNPRDLPGGYLSLTCDDGKGDWDWTKAMRYYRDDGTLSLNGYLSLSKDILLGWEEEYLRLYLMQTNIIKNEEVTDHGFKFSWRDYSDPLKESFNALEFDQNGNVYFRDGKVGIGTILPERKIHIVGDIALGNDAAGQKFIIHSRSDNEQEPGDFLSITCDKESYVDGQDKWDWNKQIRYYRKDGSLVINGNVGIGSINPESKLSVNGKITCEELEVKDVPDADFVFEANYNLRSLNELESYIAANKHLPNIPSAQEFKDKGSYILSKFDTQILQKIEELTLYIIQLKKENEILKSEINSLKN